MVQICITFYIYTKKKIYIYTKKKIYINKMSIDEKKLNEIIPNGLISSIDYKYPDYVDFDIVKETQNDKNLENKNISYKYNTTNEKNNPIYISELKTSLLLNVLHNKDNKIYKRLVEFITNEINSFFKNKKKGDEYILEYFQNRDSYIGQTLETFPVAQLQVFKDSDLDIFKNDIYVLLNILKRVDLDIIKDQWYDGYTCPVLLKKIYSDLYQQKLLPFINIIRGNRLDINTYDMENSQIGIVPYENNFLNKKIIGLDEKDYNNPLFSWRHPGYDSCRPYYIGNYGKLMKVYRDKKNALGSLQCGISASTNFILFGYLFGVGLEEKRTKKQLIEDVYLVILSCIFALVGDGGHNIREILFGLTTTIIVLKHIIDESKKENTNSRSVLYEKLKNLMDIHTIHIVEYLKDEKYLYDTIMKPLIKWEKFINIFYDFTKDINLTGIGEIELGNTKKEIKTDLEYTILFNKIKDEWLFDYYFNSTNNQDDRENKYDVYQLYQLNCLQLFLALENERYKLDFKESFEEIVTKKINIILEYFEIKHEIKKQTHINEIHNLIQKSEILDKIDLDILPFAYKKKSNKKRRSHKKKKSNKKRRSNKKRSNK